MIHLGGDIVPLLCDILYPNEKDLIAEKYRQKKIYNYSEQSLPIPHSEPFLHLRCGNGSHKSLYLHITSDLIELYISNK